MFLSTKSFWNYPCAHRQWRHDGVCKWVHGYSRSFHFRFVAKDRDACGFVVDFGSLKWVGEFLTRNFDHTLLLCKDDPLLPQFRALEAEGACKVITPPYGVGMEDTAQWVAEFTNGLLRLNTEGRCRVLSVEVRENDKNSGIWLDKELDVNSGKGTGVGFL